MTKMKDTDDGMGRLLGMLAMRPKPSNDTELEEALSGQLSEIAGAAVRVMGVASADGRPVPFAVMAASEDARTVAIALLEGYGYQVVTARTHPPALPPVIWTDGPAVDPAFPDGEWWAWLDRLDVADSRTTAASRGASKAA